MFQKMDFTEKLIFKLLQREADMGLTKFELQPILNVELKKLSWDKVTADQLKKRLQRMIGDKWIKKVTNGQQPSRKEVYLLFTIEPNIEITGGAMGSANMAQFELINNLMDRVFDHICRQTSYGA